MSEAKSGTLYSNEEISAWRRTLEAYHQVLSLKADKASSKTKKERDLMSLDKWYQEDLPTSLKGRNEMFLNLEELCQLMKWKLTRGTFRPRLMDLVKANNATTVEETSRNAFACLPDISSAIRELCKLKAVGPATASAILSAGMPETIPFMADEAMMAIPELGDISYKLPFYMKFVDKITVVLVQLKEKDPKGEWTARKVELALWTDIMAKKLDFVLFKDSATGTANSDTSKKDCNSHDLKRKAMDQPKKAKKRVKK